MKLVFSDAHQGLKKAAAKVLGATWQRCRVHFMRNALAQENQKEAKRQWRENANTLRRFRKLAELMDEAEEDVLAFMAYPRDHLPQLASTNPLERPNKEIKRRAKVVGILANDAAIIRLVGTLLIEQSDEWQATRSSMSNESMRRCWVRKTHRHRSRALRWREGAYRRPGITPLDGTLPRDE